MGKFEIRTFITKPNRTPLGAVPVRRVSVTCRSPRRAACWRRDRSPWLSVRQFSPQPLWYFSESRNQPSWSSSLSWWWPLPAEGVIWCRTGVDLECTMARVWWKFGSIREVHDTSSADWKWAPRRPVQSGGYRGRCNYGAWIDYHRVVLSARVFFP